jgi:uncharacterized protein (TIGR01440 family)
MFKEIKNQTAQAFEELCVAAKLKPGAVVVIGCSSSEVTGGIIGKNSNADAGEAIFAALNNAAAQKGIAIACQCCEHLNRALVIEKSTQIALGLEQVNAVPQPKAGGSLATAAYNGLAQPVLVERIKADAGLDIGGTLIGMHLKETAVPLRLSIKKIGEANVTAARTRAKFIGGSRTVYDEELM